MGVGIIVFLYGGIKCGLGREIRLAGGGGGRDGCCPRPEVGDQKRGCTAFECWGLREGGVCFVLSYYFNILLIFP